jgi:hypothetical protein
MEVILQPFYGKNDHSIKKITKWEVNNITKNEMTIQVNFTDPSVISPRIVSRNSEFIFINRTRKIKFKLYLNKVNFLEMLVVKNNCQRITKSSVFYQDRSSLLVININCDVGID